MRHDGAIRLFQYWNRLRGGRRSPKRTEVEPADIKTLLGDTFILESDARGEPVFRLAGTRLCAMYGRELKGFAFASLWKDRDLPMLGRLIGGVFRDKTVLVANYQAMSAKERKVGIELLLLPLEGGDHNRRALGIISPDERPYWLGVDPIALSTVESVRVVDPDREPMFLANRPSVPVPGRPDDVPEPTFFGSQAMAHLPAPARRVRHLVVLEGGRSELK